MSTPAPRDTSRGGRLRATALAEVLAKQQRRDLLGPEGADGAMEHSGRFADMVDATPGRVVDLGSGGGVPGLVLAVLHWPEAEFVLVDASEKRTTYLEVCVQELGLSDRVVVAHARAEEIGRGDLRSWADLVVARSFGPPSAVAECGAPLLRQGGLLVVSEPPGTPGERWPTTGLALLGLSLERASVIDGAGLVRLSAESLCPSAYPRRAGVPVRRPLF